MLNINDYDYPLPEERIAKYPLKERDHSKLLVYKEAVVGEDYFYHPGITYQNNHFSYITTQK